MNHQPDPVSLSPGEQRLLRVFRCLPTADQDEVLIRASRLLIRRYPLDPNNPAKDERDNLFRWQWLDEQLSCEMPFTHGIENLDGNATDALESAWPDGFDQALLGSSLYDSQQAEALIEPYLEKMTELDMPRMIDFDATAEEERKHLMEEFGKFISEWRESVLLALERAATKKV
jgi:hypothetical protein